jgi:hypothetical protein
MRKNVWKNMWRKSNERPQYNNSSFSCLSVYASLSAIGKGPLFVIYGLIRGAILFE